MAAKIALVILVVWVGIFLLATVLKGLKFALGLVFRLIAIPFRIVGFVFSQLFKIPGRIARLFGFGRPVARKVGETAGAAYTKVADGWHHQEANGWPALKKARSFVECERRQFAGMMGATREKWCKQKGRMDEHKENFRKQKENMREQKRLLKKLGKREYMRTVMEGGSAAAREAAAGAAASEAAAEAAAAAASFSTTETRIKPHTFPGYRIVREMPRGGSGAHLFLAEPKRSHVKLCAERGVELPGQVVIKSFSLQSGAPLTGILREGRALDAAKQLGQVLEHASGTDGMYYVMPFVPGDTLDEYIAKLHKPANGSFPTAEELKEELSGKQLDQVLSLSLDLISELERFHDHGLWHKDVKPGNLIVNKGRLHIVDLGLLTPLASALTLTTHGTEYFRDPEMVRLAMSGAQVRDVDAVKFDLYSAGAVLFSMLEGTFPAHGNLSRLQRPCPPALAWVVRRAMSEHESRYPSARLMRADLAFLCDAKKLDKVKPVDLPSWKQEDVQSMPPIRVRPLHTAPAAEASSPKVAVAPPARRKTRSWSKVIPKKAVAVALLSIVMLGAVMENERSEAQARDEALHASVIEKMEQHAFHAEEALGQIVPDSAGPLRTYSAFLNSESKTKWEETNQHFIEELQEALPGDELKAVYIHLADLSEMSQELYTLLEKQLGESGVTVLQQDREASLELSARAATLLDTLSPHEYPDVEGSRAFFEDQGEIQAVARIVES
ncbi:MAG: hypothetical protein GY930_04550, partial [bacterium]|nr:hypothetical protein [bacterium]